MTTLVEEEPYAAVVESELLSLTCSKCFAWNTEDLKRVRLGRCAGCKVVHYCSPKCQKDDWKDHKAECALYHSANFVPSMNARLVMRMLEKSRKHPEFKSEINDRTYDSLMHHSEKRREKTHFMNEAWTVYAEISRFKGSEVPDFESVFLALSKKAISGFPLFDASWNFNQGFRGFGIYLGLSVLDHSCRPDAFVINQGSKMILKTAKEGCVEYNDKLTINYNGGFPYMNTRQRREYLLIHYFFHCKCEECEDLESNRKKIGGRPPCCPTSWFYIPESICNNCKQQVPFEQAVLAKEAMENLNEAVVTFSVKYFSSSSDVESDRLALVPKWIKLFDLCKEVLSDDNSFLFHLFNLIASPRGDVKVSCKFVDFCLPVARKRPYCAASTDLFSCRLHYYEMAMKPLHERKDALKEALDSAQVVFGPEHEFTQMLLEKKTLYDLCDLKTR